MKFLTAYFSLFASLFSLSHAEEPSPWEFTGAAGLSLSSGNSDSVAYSMQFLGSYIKDGESVYIGSDYFYSEDGAIKSTDSLKLFGQYNHDISERFYLGAYGAYFQDSVADIDYRMDPSLLLGYRAINQSVMKLTFELGPGYTWEQQSGTKRDFSTLRWVEKFEYRFNETTKFWQSLGITPRLEDLSDYILEFEAGIETRITDRWSARTFLKQRIDSTPAAGSGRNDTALLLGVAYDFNGLPEPKSGGGRRSLLPGVSGAKKSDQGWTSIAALGGALNKGNSDSMGLNVSWETAYRSDEREFFFDFSQTYQENNGTSSEDQTASRIQYQRLLSSRDYVGASLNFLRDAEADIDYRVAPGIFAGRYFIKNDATKLSLEAGPAYTIESVNGNDESYLSLVIAERFSHQFNERISFKQALEFNAEAAELGNNSIRLTTALDTKITDSLIWRIAANHAVESQPAAGREKHDTSLTSSIAVKF